MWWKKNKKTLKIPLKPLANFTDSGAGEIVAFDVGYDGRVYIVTTKPLDYRTSDNGMASFAKTQGEKPQSYRVYQEEEGEFRLLFTIDQFTSLPASHKRTLPIIVCTLSFPKWRS